MMSQRTLASFLSLLLVSLALAGCGKKAEPAAGGTAASDSTLATNPVEQPQGQIPPQSNVPAPAAAPSGTAQNAPAPAATPPAHAPRRSSGSESHAPAPAAPAPAPAPGVTVPAGTNLAVTIGSPLNSETAKVGDSWSGALKSALSVGSATPFPAGSSVAGVVAAVQPAAKGSRAYLVLQVTSIALNGQSRAISATADSLIAGSTTKRNVGAIAGGAAAGALLGKVLGHSNKGALIGGILGGAAATGAVATSKGFQVDVPQGKDLVFHVDQDTRVRL